MKLIWLTDVHLNFLTNEERQDFYKNMADTHCDAILLSGDIAEATCLEAMLKEMAEAIGKPIYFVLGNHDYYEGAINEVRGAMQALRHKHLKYLSTAGIIQLNEDTILLGQDGWADGRLGDYENSTVSLNDSVLIEDLAKARADGKPQLLAKMQELADADAKQLKADLLKAISKKPKKIIIVTHVPPFKEACMYRGKQTDDNYLPYFTSKATGDVIKRFAELNPYIEFVVYSGHTHHPAQYEPLHNLHVKAGKAEYTRPTFQEEIIIKADGQVHKM